MAYENVTYEFIMKRMLDKVSTDHPNLDTREGSIIFNALASAAVEMAIMYTELDNSRNESFVDTATREYKLIACKQMGIDTTQFEAHAGTHKAEFNVEVPIGSTWNCDLYNYEVIEYLGLEGELHTYSMLCDTMGTAPNNTKGDLTAISDYPIGLSHAKLVECLIEGENAKSDEEIVKTYYEYVNSTVTDGNVAQYKRWCSEYDGIGNSKIFPLWEGEGTVKVSILSASNNKATDELIEEFQEYLDPGTTGMGDGVAPIGAFVTVTTATEVPINVEANIKMKSGYTNTSGIATALDEFLSKLAYEKNQVSYMTVGATILDVTGVEYVSDLKVNGGIDDIMLGEEEIPTLGTTNWVVV